jgi:hypothetical protein
MTASAVPSNWSRAERSEELIAPPVIGARCCRLLGTISRSSGYSIMAPQGFSALIGTRAVGLVVRGIGARPDSE